jgi:hypothetical protein
MKKTSPDIRTTNFQEAAECVAILNDMRTFDKLGGSDSFFGRLHVFSFLLMEEHSKAGESDRSRGCYRYKGMNQYGNIVSYHPSLKASERFVKEMGYTIENLKEIEKWFKGQGSIDTVTMAIYIREWLKKMENDHNDNTTETTDRIP